MADPFLCMLVFCRIGLATLDIRRACLRLILDRVEESRIDHGFVSQHGLPGILVCASEVARAQPTASWACIFARLLYGRIL